MYRYGFIENIYTCAGIFYILEVKQYIWMSERCTKNTFIFISVLIMSTNGLIKVNPLPLGRNSQWIHKILLVSSFENKNSDKFCNSSSRELLWKLLLFSAVKGKTQRHLHVYFFALIPSEDIHISFHLSSSKPSAAQGCKYRAGTGCVQEH